MKRHWRYSLRTLIALPLVVGIGIILFDRLWVYDQSASGTELVEVSVIDAADGTPVAGAILQSSDTSREPHPKTTSANGNVAFAHSYKYERFTSLLRDRYKQLSAHTIWVSAPGYLPVTIEVESYRINKPYKYGLTHQILVRLARSKDDSEK